MVSYTTKNVTSFITGTNIYSKKNTNTNKLLPPCSKKCNGEEENYDNDNDVIWTELRW